MTGLLLYLRYRCWRYRQAQPAAPPAPATAQPAAAGGDGASQPPQPAVQHLPGGPGFQGGGYRPRPRVPRWALWAAVAVVAGLVFRRALAWAVVTVLAGAFHLVGLDVHLPHVRFAWPWQVATAGTTTNTDIGPWVLQKVEGISRPALGQANFTFVFTHKVSKGIGPWPCWYASTFYAVAHASATVDLNPGPAWWAPGAGHYSLVVLARPAASRPGRVSVTMALPPPQLPATPHDVVIDDIPSRPLDTQHSWTYPGLGCGLVLKPQFAQSVLYVQAQRIAYWKATQSPYITGPLTAAAERVAAQTIRDNFIQPTVNAFGYTLASFTLRWATPPSMHPHG